MPETTVESTVVVVPQSNFNLKEIFNKSLEDVDDIIENFGKHIRKIEIPKKDGTKRKVLAPDGKLKFIQKHLYWKFFRRYRASKSAHGFVAKRGIVTNARLHVGAMSLGKIDIEKFFDSISKKHLRNCIFGNRNICRYCKNYEGMLNGNCHPSLYKNKRIDFPHKCEEIKAVYIKDFCEKTGYQSLFNRIIDIVTYNDFTAQGFPTSPIIANIVLVGFDKRMQEFCKEHNVTYTRYADDLCFSSKELTAKDLKALLQTKAYQLLWAFGFRPNRKKTNWKSCVGRLKVCGVVVNVKTSIQRSVLRRFRAKVHHATVINADSTTRPQLRRLKGFASYVMSVDRRKGNLYMQKLVEFENKKFPKALSSNDQAKVA